MTITSNLESEKRAYETPTYVPGHKVDLEGQEDDLALPRVVLLLAGRGFGDDGHGLDLGRLLGQDAQLCVVQLHVNTALGPMMILTIF
jgi:hypothetical protein